MEYAIIEIGIVLLFLICIYHARKSLNNLALLGLGAIYAVIFENFNAVLSAGKTGGYFYSDSFRIFIGNTPLFVILAWAILIYTAYHIVNYLGIKESRKPFADAVFITVIDIAADPVAAGLGLWTWIGYSASDGFFGVPGNNFLGWLLISFVFMLSFRKMEASRLKYKRALYVLIPAVSYALFLVVFGAVSKAEETFNFSKTAELIMFFFIFAGFVLLITKEHTNHVLKCMVWKRMLFWDAENKNIHLRTKVCNFLFSRITRGRKNDVLEDMLGNREFRSNNIKLNAQNKWNLYLAGFIRGLFYLFSVIGIIYLGRYKNDFGFIVIVFGLILGEVLVFKKCISS